MHYTKYPHSLFTAMLQLYSKLSSVKSQNVLIKTTYTGRAFLSQACTELGHNGRREPLTGNGTTPRSDQEPQACFLFLLSFQKQRAAL